jgi:TPR repeat protein
MSTTPKPLVAHIYNPDNQTREQLIDSFVVRVEKFKRVFAEIKTTPDRFPVQHYVIEGKRGMGKTTFLLRLAYEIEDDPDLNGWLLPLVFNEEEYSIRKLYKLWERVAILLGEADKVYAGLFQEMDGQFDDHPSEDAYEEAMFKLLTRRLQERGKKIILFIDNFGDIFSRFSLHENQRLRTVLQTSPDLQIIAASSVVLEVFFEYKHPFYDFFKVIRLSGLSREENTALLLKLGETYKQEQIKDILANQPGRVEALRRLTGGVIRTVVLLFEIFIDKKQGSAFDDLEAILDRVSTLFKHRMDDLSKGSPEQGEIVNAVALGWDAMTAEEIAKATRLQVELVDKQLDSLLKNETLDRTLNPNGQHLYSVSERFFNIWYLMRHGRKGDKRRVLWLVRFLEEWCDEKLIVQRAEEHIAAMKMGTYKERGAYYMTEALAQTRHLPMEIQHELISTTRKYLEERKSEFVQYLSESEFELVEKTKFYYNNERFLEALEFLLKAKVKDFFRIGVCYHIGLRNFDKAKKYYSIAIENGDSQAMYNLANLNFNELQDYGEAEKYYLKAIEMGHIEAIHNLAGLYFRGFNNIEYAKKYYLQAINNGHEQSKYQYAIILSWFESNIEEAKKLLLELAEKNHLASVFALAHLLETEFLYFEEAEIFYIKSLEIGILCDDEFHSKFPDAFSRLTKFLLSRSHYPLLYQHFTSPEAEKLNLKDRLKPLWYALMYYMQEEHPNEYLRMGEELRETVQEIIAEVEEMRKRYGKEAETK